MEQSKLHIITIHGIGASCYPHYPLINKLKEDGYDSDVFIYKSRSITLREASNLLDKFIEENVSDKVILVGHSAGGRIALLSEHPKIVGIITIASPIQGSYFASKTSFMNIYYGPMLLELSEPHSEEITIPLVTITTSYLYNFDGRIWTEEMKHKNSCYEKHIDNSFHSGAQMADDRIIDAVKEAIVYLNIN